MIFQGKNGPLLIAEIGGNHEGNFDIAIKNFKLVLPTDYKRALSNNEQVYKVKARKKG